MNRKSIGLLIFSSLLVSASAHFFFFQEWLNGRYMLGPNDGLSQMLPFKQFIYDHYTEGNFFYSFRFGLGGGFYSQLAYYFSTSIIFLLTIIIVYVLEVVQIMGPPDVKFWADVAIWVSIIRLSLILFVTTWAFRYLHIEKTAAFTGAVVYGLSVMYFRHVVFWEFFSDAMIWIPLLVVATEKVIREGRLVSFIIIVALMLFNNFYFSYINLVFLAVYIIGRWFIPLTTNERGKIEQCKLFITSGLISFCLSAVSFIPASYGFFNNHRPPFEAEVPLFATVDHPLFASRYIIIPAIFVLLIWMKSLYKHSLFRLFALLSFSLTLLHYSPVAGSAFNGFSAPQYRFEYLLSFTIAGCVAVGMQHIKNVYLKEIALAVIASLTIYSISSAFLDSTTAVSVVKKISFTLLLITALLLVLYRWKTSIVLLRCLQGWLILSSLLVVNLYQWTLSEHASVKTVTKEFLESASYNSNEQQQLIQQIQAKTNEPFEKIDWMVSIRNNTPMVQRFHGTSLYSSIFNQQLLFFYWRDLQIDMGRESVSRYATLGNRTNLHSLLQANVWVRPKEQQANVPYGFKKSLETKNYIAYHNSLPLPFARTTKKVFSEKELQQGSMLDREHAMLQGIVLKDETIPHQSWDTPVNNQINRATIEAVGGTYQRDKLAIKKNVGGIDITPKESNKKTADYYFGFHIENIDGLPFTLTVNDYETSRKAFESIYKTNVNDLMIRVPKKEKISIRVPKGHYVVKSMTLFEEDYQVLKEVATKNEHAPNIMIKRNKVTIDYNNRTDERWMALPIPFEKGWKLRINGEKQPIYEANYAFIGLSLQQGRNQIELTYTPPFFFFSLILLTIGLVSVYYVWNTKRGCH
ncbi:YfhO family protein [Bacillus sp. FJAT-42315]|uniref:YfhO family protein n=1 Tax=Bacillus sp. FJAT-42315 TaxID=2014077 RepID=UPI000C23D74D|nr:YfhO family protein [Bacillus sp. FJAT-42315]